MTTTYFKVAKRTPAHRAQLFLEHLNRDRGAFRKDIFMQLCIPASASWYKSSEGGVQGIYWSEIPTADWKQVNKDPVAFMPRTSTKAGRLAQSLLSRIRFMNKHDVMKSFFGQDQVPMVVLPNPGGSGFLMPSLGYQMGTGRCGGTAYIAIHMKILAVEGVKPVEGLVEITASEYEKAIMVKSKGKKARAA
jgi:hypothetical protein